MNKQEVALLLSALSEWQYIEPSEVGIQMWAASLDDVIPVDFAITYVAKWYGKADATKLLPGHINKAWKDSRSTIRDRHEIASYYTADKTPMPDWFKAAMMDAFGSTELGRLPKSGRDVQEIFDQALELAEEAKWKPYG